MLLWPYMRLPEKALRLEVADRLHSAAIHLLRHARSQDVLARQAPARLSALSVLVFGGPMTLGQLAAAEQVKPPTMSRIVAGLQRSALAEIRMDARDARRIRIQATLAGKRLLQQARKRRIDLLAQRFSDLNSAELTRLLESAKIIETSIAPPQNRARP